MHTIDHVTGEPMAPNRNVLVESARIARSDIAAVTALQCADFDALIVPGGFGAAKNLSDFAVQGANASVNEQALSACRAFAEAGKPAGYVCIAPALVPLVYPQGVKVTIGYDAETAAAIQAMGAVHVVCDVTQAVADDTHKVVSTRAYMLAQSILDADAGIGELVAKVLGYCD